MPAVRRFRVHCMQQGYFVEESQLRLNGGLTAQIAFEFLTIRNLGEETPGAVHRLRTITGLLPYCRPLARNSTYQSKGSGLWGVIAQHGLDITV